jgi:hypothetical protein
MTLLCLTGGKIALRKANIGEQYEPGTVLIILLVLALIGVLPTWGKCFMGRNGGFETCHSLQRMVNRRPVQLD